MSETDEMTWADDGGPVNTLASTVEKETTVNRIIWTEQDSTDRSYWKGTVGRFHWCDIARKDVSWWFQPRKYEYVLRTLVRSAGTHETHKLTKHTRCYGGFFATLEEAQQEAEMILGVFLDEANAI